MSFTHKLTPFTYVYEINGIQLARPNVMRDLGVIYDPKLSFKYHIDSIVSSAFKSLGFILRNGRLFNDVDTLKLLYTAYVRSHLEYASLVWSHLYNIYISELERVQRRFLKTASYLSEGVYPPQGYPQELLLRKFSLNSLVTRRIEHSILFLFNLIHGRHECVCILNQLDFKIPVRDTRSNDTFYIKTSRTNIMSNSPLIFMLANYTCIQDNIDIFNSTSNDIKKQFRPEHP